MTGGLRSQQGALPLRLHQLLLHFDILLPEQGQVLLQFLHLLCTTEGERIREKEKNGSDGEPGAEKRKMRKIIVIKIRERNKVEMYITRKWEEY